MTAPTTDAEDLAAEIDAIVIPRTTYAQKRDALKCVWNRCPEDGRTTVLQALGLAPYDSNLSGHRPPDRAGMGPRYADRQTQDRTRDAAPLAPASSPDCGSIKGAQAHHRAEEPLCALCQAWSDERHRRTRVEPGSKCATAKGAQMHRQLGEKVCDPCRAAESAASSKRYAATRQPSPNPPGRPRKHPVPVDRPSTPRDRQLLLLAAYGAISCRTGHYLTAAGDDVTTHVVALSKAGWVNLRALTGAPVLTDAGRKVIDPSTRTETAA